MRPCYEKKVTLAYENSEGIDQGLRCSSINTALYNYLKVDRERPAPSALLHKADQDLS